MKVLSLNLGAIVNNRKIIAVGLIAFISGVLLCGALLNLSQIMPYFSVSGEPLQRFSSYEELVDFVGTSSRHPYYFANNDDGVLYALAEAKGADTSGGYSATNIQVAGVDEADIVKSDGEYLYVASNGSVFIIKAYPPEKAEILYKIELNGTLHGIFVYEDRLVVFGSDAYEVRILASVIEPNIVEPSYMPYYTPNTFIKVYDISDKASPVSARNITLDGYYFSSRMIGNYVYTIINEPVLLNGTKVKLPTIHAEGETVVVSATDIYYSTVKDYGFTFTSIFAVNVVDDAEEPAHETILLGTTRSIYVSFNNIYVAFSEVDSVTGAEKTLIYRIRVDGGDIENKASGGVSGSVLNQFSMDEYGSYLRIATTVGFWDSSQNNVYVLNMSLSVVGRLENLAQGESIYAVRFMGDRCYLVTFRQRDPFFVIDLSTPVEPEMLGYLKIPGYSSYLHPYDADHIIGIGMNGSNLKMSLFDVANVSAPTELDNFMVQGSWSGSPVLSDHKAFLFNKTRELLAIPVTVSATKVVDEYHYTYSQWQGAYVFDVSLEHGFVLRGNVTHQESTTSIFQYYYGSEVQRILYIDEVLYTVSDRKILLNSLDTLEQIGEIELL
ncbi:MAG: beta-propeller domain-containing protein [Candidatus Bathyarchaeota archaeon]|nr:beta-propeller domain-containing protein [Candidatus Bathyarchaeota archaeon]